MLQEPQPGVSTPSVEALLTVEDVRKVLRCSRAQVYAMIAEGFLPKVRLPMRKTRIRREDLEALISGSVAS